MGHKSGWLEEIIEVLEELDGHAYYKDIYKRIIERNNMDLEKNRNWRAAVRATIERFSSDCDAYSGKKDIFFAVEGKGKGHWGLRDFKFEDRDSYFIEEDNVFPEGKIKFRLHLYRERNPKVIKKAKDNFIKKNKKIYCEICGFCYEDVYGDVGKGYIEGHHIKPVSELSEDEETKVEDIILICANCHKMIHRKRPWLSKDDIKSLIENGVKEKEIVDSVNKVRKLNTDD